jgi:serine/threonine-protein kinase
MAIGALACVAVLIGGAIALPHFWKSAAATTNTKPDAVVSAPVTVQTPVVQQPVTTTPPSPITETPQPNSTPPVSNTPHKGFARVEQTKPTPTPANEPTNTPVVTPQPPVQSAVAPPPGPTQEQIDAAGEELMKVKSRAESIRGSLDHLRSQQAADGLSINPTVVSGASRMDGYLQAAERALQSNNLEAARKNTERADAEVTKLEAFFGR